MPDESELAEGEAVQVGDPVVIPVTRQYVDEEGNLITVGYPSDGTSTVAVTPVVEPGTSEPNPMDGYTGLPS